MPEASRHPKYPIAEVTDLEAAIRQLRQINCILDSCTSSASYEVSQAQKALLLLPHTAKGASTSSEVLGSNKSDVFGARPSQQAPLELSTRNCQEYDDKSTTERTLSAPARLFHCPFHICFLTVVRVSLSVSPFFSTILVATRRCRCLLRSDYG